MGTVSGHAALEAGNQSFHEAYSGARDGVRDQVPILVVLPTELALHHQGKRQARPYSCATFAAAKSAAHVAVALFALTSAEAPADRRRAGVARLLDSLGTALQATPGAESQPLELTIRGLLERCLHFARAARDESPSPQQRADFAKDAGPRILQVTELATAQQVAGLHEAAEAVLRTLSAREQAELQVVVLGDHQARTRSLGMQYFKARLRETPGTDDRVTYGENIDDEDEALSLVATRRLDKQIASAFFGDETRLQRDVLGDAAKRCIERMDLHHD